jgi:hypothetical protein
MQSFTCMACILMNSQYFSTLHRAASMEGQRGHNMCTLLRNAPQLSNTARDLTLLGSLQTRDT